MINPVELWTEFNGKLHRLDLNFNDGDHLVIWISYDTVIAFYTPETGQVISENIWSSTTGRHLNSINPDHKIRIPYEEFKTQLHEITQRLHLKPAPTNTNTHDQNPQVKT